LFTFFVWFVFVGFLPHRAQIRASTLEDFPADALPMPPIFVVSPGAQQVQEYSARAGFCDPGLQIILADGDPWFLIHGGKPSAVLHFRLSHGSAILL
jgi:hypothetical protein